MKFAQTVATTISFNALLSDFKALTKMRLAVSVVVSSIAGYFLGADTIQWPHLVYLAFGGYCMVGASNIYNQIIERDLDALMKRTQQRPIPDGRVSPQAALAMAILLTLLGVATLYLLNAKTAFIWLLIYISLRLCIYTTKNKNTLSGICWSHTWRHTFYVRLGGSNQ